MKKRILLNLFLICLICFTFTACNSSEGKSTEEKITEAKAALTLADIDGVEDTIELPATGLNGAAITWVSSNQDILRNDGTVAERPVNDVDITLTATITLNEKSDTKDFAITVRERNKAIYNEKCQKDINFFEWDGIIEINEDTTLTLKDGGSLTRFGGYDSVWQDMVWNEGYTAGIEIYLDPDAFLEDEYFIWACALNNTDGVYVSETYLHVRKTDGVLKVGAAGKPNVLGYTPFGSSNEFNEVATSDNTAKIISEPGWYTMKVKFYDNNENTIIREWKLIKNSDHKVIFMHTHEMTRSEESAIISLKTDLVGGNRYGWFTQIIVEQGINIKSVWLDTNQ